MLPDIYRFRLILILCGSLIGGTLLSDITHAAERANVSPSITTPRISPKPFIDEPVKIDIRSPLIDQAPEGAADISFVLKEIQIEGGLSELEQNMEQIYKDSIGQEITIVDLFNIAQKIEQTYHEAGYFLVQVLVPVQVIDNGIAKIVVVSGHVSKLDVSSISERYQEIVLSILHEVVSKKNISRQLLERKLLLVNKLAGLAVEATLAPGSESGSTILILEGKDRLISGFLSVDNHSSRSIGHETGLLYVSANSALQSGESIYAAVGGHPSIKDITSHQPIESLGIAGINIPIGDDGLQLKLEASISENHPRGNISTLEARGRMIRYLVGMSYPLVLNRQQQLTIDFNFDSVDEVFQSDATGNRTTLTHDSLRTFRIGLNNYQQNILNGQMFVTARLSQGVDAFGARNEDATGATLSRTGAEPEFTKVDSYFSYDRAIPLNMYASLTAKGQLSLSGSLLVPEQFSIGGADFGSGQDTGAVIGDDGFAVRSEISRPIPISQETLLFGLRPYVFFDYGRVYRRSPTAAEDKNTTIADSGIGLYFDVAGSERSEQRLNAKFEVATRLEGPEETNSGERYSFKIGYSF
jgi:hemolysin activation/secretion protein